MLRTGYSRFCVWRWLVAEFGTLLPTGACRDGYAEGKPRDAALSSRAHCGGPRRCRLVRRTPALVPLYMRGWIYSRTSHKVLCCSLVRTVAVPAAVVAYARPGTAVGERML